MLGRWPFRNTVKKNPSGYITPYSLSMHKYFHRDCWWVERHVWFHVGACSVIFSGACVGERVKPAGWGTHLIMWDASVGGELTGGLLTLEKTNHTRTNRGSCHGHLFLQWMNLWFKWCKMKLANPVVPKLLTVSYPMWLSKSYHCPRVQSTPRITDCLLYTN